MKRQWLLLLAIFVTTIAPHGGKHDPPWIQGTRGGKHDPTWEINPNPINPRANVEFELAHDAMVSIRVYDIHGRLATTLADRRMPAGTNSVAFDGARMASGVYLVAFRVEGEKALVKRVTVLK